MLGRKLGRARRRVGLALSARSRSIGYGPACMIELVLRGGLADVKVRSGSRDRSKSNLSVSR